MQTWTVKQEDIRKAWGQGVCLEQSPLAVLPVNESTLVPSQPHRTMSHIAGTLFLQGRGSRGSWGQLQHVHRCTQCVCLHAKKKWKTEPALHLLSLQVFFASWQREKQSKVRKCQEVPAHLATGQSKGYGPLLTLQSNCPLLPVLPGMSCPHLRESLGAAATRSHGLQTALPNPASLPVRGALRD